MNNLEATPPLPGELERTVEDGHARLDSALARLASVSTAQMTLGGHVARRPWTWLLGAGAVGLLLGLRDPLDPLRRRG